MKTRQLLPNPPLIISIENMNMEPMPRSNSKIW